MAERINVIIADDHSIVRQGIRQYLELTDDITVVAEAAEGNQAIAMINAYRPDVVLLDINMPGMTGVEVTQKLKAQHPDIKILILTAYDEDPYVFSLLQAGANGYLLKNCDIEELQKAVRAVHQGKTVLSPVVADKIVRQIQRTTPAQPDNASSLEDLTNRELEILRLAAKGYTNKAIGQDIGISDRTVQGHLANIYAKLNVASRTEAVTEAVKRKLIDLD
ncbi:MAG: response regulator transcription factor [Chloroflexi bacterium]|nr:response regulator transcription factor [Chloroflexota bacterium]